MYKIRKFQIALMLTGLMTVSLLSSACTRNVPVATYTTSPEDYTYKLENKINNKHTLLDRLSAGSDGVNLQSQTGKTLSHTLAVKAGISITFPEGFEIDVAELGYTLTTDDTKLSGQLINGLKKGQIVEFYHSKTDHVFGVYSKSDGKRVGTLTIPTAEMDCKVYNPDLTILKDFGESWSPASNERPVTVIQLGCCN